MKRVKTLQRLVTAMVSLLTILQHIVLVLPEDQKDWNSFDRFLNGIVRAGGWRWILTVLIILLVILTIADIVLSRSKTYHFKVKSPPFNRFFTKWYNQPGKLIIICDNIDWTCSPIDRSVFHALEAKCDDGLKLYLGSGYNSALADQLRAKGAKVFHAKRALIERYSFSCLAPMGNFSNIIVRDKFMDTKQSVQFSESSDARVIALLTALLEDDGYGTLDESTDCQPLGSQHKDSR